VFLHTSPLVDIAQGSPSILADKMALKMVGSKGFVGEEKIHFIFFNQNVLFFCYHFSF